MVILSKIYTKSGDKGKTSLGSGQRILKSHLRIEALGQVDEANAFVGWINTIGDIPFNFIIEKIQNDLFDAGADLCVLEHDHTLSTSKLRITKNQVEALEKFIDEYNEGLPPLTSFILPGGSNHTAALHLARTVVRRAERTIVALSHEAEINIEIICYLNRLSDLLFVLARYANTFHNKEDVLWIPGANQ